MLLKDLQPDNWFVFEDKSTPLVIAAPGVGKMLATGTWVYIGTGGGGCPIVRRADIVSSATMLVANTYLRSVLPIVG